MNKEESKTYIQLTAEEFIDAWNGDYKGVKKEDGKGYWASEHGNMLCKGIKVIEEVSIENLHNLPTLFVENSEFGIFSMSKSTANSIVFTSVEIDLFYIFLFSKTNDIDIQKSKIGELKISNNSTVGGIGINYSTIETFSISGNVQVFGDVRISNSTIVNKLQIASSCVWNLYIVNTTSITGLLSIINSKLYRLYLSSKESRKINIVESYIQKLEWKQDSFCVLAIDECQVESLLFKQAIIPKDSVFQISDSRINTLKCVNFVNTAWLNISSLKPLVKYNRFIKSDDDNLSEFQFEEVCNTAKIHLENSDLGKTSFVNCNLDGFDKFVYYNTKMLEVFMAGTNLPQKSEKFALPEGTDKKETDKKERNSQQRFAYSQFKKISENRGDNVQATEFLALEMDAYAKHLSEDSAKWGERFNLWLNKISSNWGNNWVQAVLVTLGINSFLFLLYCLCLGYKLGNDCNLFYKLASYSLEFLNPLRKGDFLQAEVTPLARVVDYASRIIVAYFTFQSIQAFRRFGRKS